MNESPACQVDYPLTNKVMSSAGVCDKSQQAKEAGFFRLTFASIGL